MQNLHIFNIISIYDRAALLGQIVCIVHDCNPIKNKLLEPP